MKTHSTTTLLVAILFSCLLPMLTFASIQELIDAANDGDIILIEPGTYTENINFNGKNVMIRSTGGPEVTTIDGNQSGSCVRITNGENESAGVDGLTLTNGSGWFSGTVWLGGGIVVRNSASPTLTNLIVTGNTVTSGSEPAGGGISIGVNSNPHLEEIVVINNTSGYGGGISIYQSNPTLENVIISGNHALLTGGGIYITDCDPQLYRIQINNNTADFYGGGIYVLFNAYPVFDQITVTENICVIGGGGMVVHANGSPIIENSIFWGNIPDQVLLYDGGQDPNTLTVSFTDMMDGAEGIELGEGTIIWEDGNIDEDPWFCDPAEDVFTLADDSPCLGTGAAAVDMGALGIGCANPVALDEDLPLPNKFVLHQNYPNPFNPTTTISYDLPEQATVSLTLYDVRGLEIVRLENGVKSPGNYDVHWNGVDRSGNPMNTGVYFARLQAGEYSQTIKMLYLK